MATPTVDVVIVARNEGESFVKCCAAAAKAVAALKSRDGLEAVVTYVDSYSTDGSVAVAERHGFRVVRPPDWYFNCANGRTAGYLLTGAEFVMFLDGDMEMAEGWLSDGLAFLRARPAAGGVAGIRDDMRLAGSSYVRIPNYHRVTAPVQDVGRDVGGAFLFRRAALDATGGYEPAIVPEEDFIGYAQMRKKGWELYRIDKPMITHWDTKVSTPLAVVRHLMYSRKALVPGAIFRHALFHTDWWPHLLRFRTDLLAHAAWLLTAAFVRPAPWPLAATALYLAVIWREKRDPLRTAGALADFLAQDYPKSLLQLVLVDGMSADASPRLAREFRAAHPELDVAVLDNPGRLLASGWNVALAAAKGDVIVRVDAHASIPPDFVRRHVEAHRRGHAITGGPTVTTLPDAFWPRLLSVAENSPFGGGAAAFRRRTEEGYVDTLAHAAYAREVFAKVGGYDERLARTEDNEMHERMKRAGYRFWFDPEIRSARKARPTLGGLLAQKFGNGRWIGLTLAVSPRAFGLRHFVPGAFVLGLVIAPVPVLAAYAVAAGAFALLAASRERPAYVLAAPLLCAVFLLMHLAYGFGTLAGLAAMPLFKWKTRDYVVPRPVSA